MKIGTLVPIAEECCVYVTKGNRIQFTGEVRCPRKGEWFISGAIAEGYLAVNDLSVKHHIGKLVTVKVTTTIVEEVIYDQAKLFKQHQITAKKYMGDDEYCWAVFVAGRPIMTGLTRSEVPHYKHEVLCRQIEKTK